MMADIDALRRARCVLKGIVTRARRPRRGASRYRRSASHLLRDPCARGFIRPSSTRPQCLPTMASPEDLRKLSTLLDEAFKLPASGLEPWLAGLQGDAVHLAPRLRELLQQHASKETIAVLRGLPEFTAVGSAEHRSEFSAGDAVGPYR